MSIFELKNSSQTLGLHIYCIHKLGKFGRKMILRSLHTWGKALVSNMTQTTWKAHCCHILFFFLRSSCKQLRPKEFPGARARRWPSTVRVKSKPLSVSNNDLKTWTHSSTICLAEGDYVRGKLAKQNLVSSRVNEEWCYFLLYTWKWT